MDESQKQARINNIANRYETKIHQQFGKYVDFSKYDDMRTNVFILEHDDFLQKYNGEGTAAGFCNSKNGYIYLDDSLFSEDRTLVHEYIHRISTIKLPDERFMTGIHHPDDALCAWNEILTEYFCFKITEQISEQSVYWNFKFLFDLIEQYICYDDILAIYFRNDKVRLKSMIGEVEYNHIEAIILSMLYPHSDFDDGILCSFTIRQKISRITNCFFKNAPFYPTTINSNDFKAFQ